jgi:hypothetical protein
MPSSCTAFVTNVRIGIYKPLFLTGTVKMGGKKTGFFGVKNCEKKIIFYMKMHVDEKKTNFFTQVKPLRNLPASVRNL